MNIEEVKELKAQTEKEIAKLLFDFARATGVCVDNISIESVNSHGGTHTFRPLVTLWVRL